LSGAERLKKLKFLCRRGMKELDVLLERFLQLQRQSLLQGGWPEFEELLQSEDGQLWRWLQDPAVPAATSYRRLLLQIRDGATEPG
jgi:antitoxin CptB